EQYQSCQQIEEDKRLEQLDNKVIHVVLTSRFVPPESKGLVPEGFPFSREPQASAERRRLSAARGKMLLPPALPGERVRCTPRPARSDGRGPGEAEQHGKAQIIAD